MSLFNNPDDDDQMLIDQIPCQYYTTETVNQYFSETVNNNFIIFHANIRSFFCNYDEMSIVLNGLRRKPDVLVFSETWFSSETCEPISGYVGYHVVRNGRGYGGISVYIKDNLPSHSLDEHSYVNDVLEINIVRVALAGRPPSRLLTPEFNVHVSQVLATFRGLALVYVVGDINIDLLQEGGSHSDFIETMRSQSFVPLITIPTRVTDTSATLLDHI